MLTSTKLASTGGFELRDVRCRSNRAGWSGTEVAETYVVVFVRDGSFRRRVAGREAVVDPTRAYFVRPGDEESFGHAGETEDSCTAVELTERFLAGMWGGEPGLPGHEVPTTTALDLAHRRLLAATSAADASEVTERVAQVVSSLLGQVHPARVGAGGPATVASRARLVADTREALAADPSLSLLELAGLVAVSPHHLSRIFKTHAGETVTRYRNRLRCRLALERLAAGHADLSGLASELGFADHAHLSRTIRRELGAPPSQLRRELADSSRQPR